MFCLPRMSPCETNRQSFGEQTHRQWLSGSVCSCPLVTSSFRQLHELVIAWPPRVSILFFLENRFLIPLERPRYGSLYLKYILLKAEVSMERWTDCWSFSCSGLLFNKYSFSSMWFSALGAVMKAGKVHRVYHGLWEGAWDFESALVL